MNVIRWEDPPADLFEQLAAELREHPGRWAVVSETFLRRDAVNLVERIRSGAGSFAPLGSMQARIRTGENPGGRVVVRVYARYVGDSQAGTSGEERAGEARA
jgi:hypothetical protein